MDYVVAVHRERNLLDDQKRNEEELKWLNQTLTLLNLNSCDPSTDPQVSAVARMIKGKKEKNDDIVSNKM